MIKGYVGVEEIRRQFSKIGIDKELTAIACKAYEHLNTESGRPRYQWDFQDIILDQPVMAWSNSRQKLAVALSLLEKNGYVARSHDERYSAVK